MIHEALMRNEQDFTLNGLLKRTTQRSSLGVWQALNCHKVAESLNIPPRTWELHLN